MSGGSCRTTLERLHTFPALPTCSCPLWLSPLGRLGDPEVFSSELLLSAKGIDQWVKWRTSSAYLTRFTLARFPARLVFEKREARSRSSPSSVIFAATGEMIPPWGVPSSVAWN